MRPPHTARSPAGASPAALGRGRQTAAADASQFSPPPAGYRLTSRMARYAIAAPVGGNDVADAVGPRSRHHLARARATTRTTPCPTPPTSRPCARSRQRRPATTTSAATIEQGVAELDHPAPLRSSSPGPARRAAAHRGLAVLQPRPRHRRRRAVRHPVRAGRARRPAPSVHLGGYIDRGFDDLDWLPDPPIELDRRGLAPHTGGAR